VYALIPHARRLDQRHPFVDFGAHALSERLRRALGSAVSACHDGAGKSFWQA
jgi:hypothetical protein